MLNLEKIFTPAEIEEWKDTLIDWEASGTIADPDDYDEWLGELSVFERELKGAELDEETVAHWRAKLKKTTAARRKQYAKEAEEIRRREEAEEKRKEELRTAFLERRGQGETVLAFSRREKIDVYETLSIATNLKKSERLAVANAREVLLEDIREQNGATAARRLAFLGGQLSRIEEELGKRDLTDLPTEKLLDYAAKYASLLKAEDAALTLKDVGDFGMTDTFTV